MPWWAIPAWILGCASLAYLVVALAAVWRWTFRAKPDLGTDETDLPAVSILKPLCGYEPDLYQNLATFFEQTYPEYQIVFGVMEENDPALITVRALQQAYPDRDVDVVVDASQIGSNRKVSNLSNMMKVAKYDHLVISDSDIAVTPTYLATVIQELCRPGVGLVTCLYRGRAGHSLFSRLGAMYINQWFLPSVLVGHMLGYQQYSFGSTIAIHRDALEAVGGISVMAGQLADDYRLGELIRRQGLRTVLSSYVVTNAVTEESLWALTRHELRWARTIRSVQPVGYAFSFITHALPVCLLMFFVLWGVASGFILPVAAIVLRMVLHAVTVRTLKTGKLWEAVLIPMRDILTFFFFCSSFAGNRISWRAKEFSLHSDGSLRAQHEIETP